MKRFAQLKFDVDVNMCEHMWTLNNIDSSWDSGLAGETRSERPEDPDSLSAFRSDWLKTRKSESIAACIFITLIKLIVKCNRRLAITYDSRCSSRKWHEFRLCVAAAKFWSADPL